MIKFLIVLCLVVAITLGITLICERFASITITFNKANP